MNEVTTTTSGPSRELPNLSFTFRMDGSPWLTVQRPPNYISGLKFSQMLSLIAALGKVPIRQERWLCHNEDIVFLNYRIIGISFFSVGELVWDFMSQAEDLSASAWCWYRAKSMGLERPYVSIG